MSIEAMKQALEHVQEFKRRWWQVPAFGNKVNKATREAITNAHSSIFELEHAIREALAEQANEPDWKAEATALRVNEQNLLAKLAEQQAPLYTSPPASKPLTDEEIKIIWRDIDGTEGMLMRFARAIEATHGITKGNT